MACCPSTLYIDPTTTDLHPILTICEYHLCTGCTRSNFRVGLQLAYMSSTPPQTGCMTTTPCSLTACKTSCVGQTPRCVHMMQSRPGHAHLHNPVMAQAVLSANSSIVTACSLIIDRVVCMQSHSSLLCVSLATFMLVIVTIIVTCWVSQQASGACEQVSSLQTGLLQALCMLWCNFDLCTSDSSALTQAYEDHVQELDRLRWIHEASQMQYVTTLAWQAKQEAMLESTRVSISRAASVQVCQTLHSGAFAASRMR